MTWLRILPSASDAICRSQAQSDVARFKTKLVQLKVWNLCLVEPRTNPKTRSSCTGTPWPKCRVCGYSGPHYSFQIREADLAVIQILNFGGISIERRSLGARPAWSNQGPHEELASVLLGHAVGFVGAISADEFVSSEKVLNRNKSRSGRSRRHTLLPRKGNAFLTSPRFLLIVSHFIEMHYKNQVGRPFASGGSFRRTSRGGRDRDRGI